MVAASTAGIKKTSAAEVVSANKIVKKQNMKKNLFKPIKI